eukprot:TRINITY_DN207_c3_g2_i1.p1 TRINITY_DN207_c3_g2~~TRINITY_DN207_c3_g2_i1.p1  ORF type:complete len:282 (+),score=65.44 TRINITY_DN207_c3_g2_i1:56-901(+)
MTLTKKSEVKVFGGMVTKYTHNSTTTNTEMTFSIYIPEGSEKMPVIYWLSGLTCTDDNFNMKSGGHRYASEQKVIIVMPDTSPRGAGVEGEDESWDFGTGAGFYVNATTDAFKKHYNMFDYVNKELPALVEASFPVIAGVKSIMGHSMGGHGALVSAFKNPVYKSVSAFAPITNPTQCPWGEKAFKGYLGSVEAGKEYDATELMAKNGPYDIPILCDVGTADGFLDSPNQLLPDNFSSICTEKKQNLVSRKQEGYDHSYYFISTFIEEHIKFHAKHLYGSA